MNLKGILFALGAGFLFGLIPTLSKISYNSGANPAFAIILRYFIATIFVIGPLYYIKIDYTLIKKYSFSLLLISFGFICLTSGLLTSVSYIPVSLVAVIFYTYPLIIVSYVFLKGKKLSKFQVTGFFIAFIGLILALGPSFNNSNLLGISLAFLAAIGAAIILITNEFLSQYFHSIIINSFINIICCIFFSIIIFSNFDLSLPFSTLGWICIIISALCYSTALFFQINAVQNIGSAPTSLLLYIEPLTIIISAIVLLNESFTILQTLGTTIVLFSLIVITQDFKRSINQ